MFLWSAAFSSTAASVQAVTPCLSPVVLYFTKHGTSIYWGVSIGRDVWQVDRQTWVERFKTYLSQNVNCFYCSMSVEIIGYTQDKMNSQFIAEMAELFWCVINSAWIHMPALDALYYPERIITLNLRLFFLTCLLPTPKTIGKGY